jgi:hypothetical protein
LKNIIEISITKNKNDLKSIAVKIKKSRTNPKNSILHSRNELLKIGNKLLSNTQIAATQFLNEALNHLARIDAIYYLQQNYGDLQFSDLYHRNFLMFQWVYEHIYKFYASVKGIGDLRGIPSHDLKVYHALTFPMITIPESMNEFNFHRNSHYTYELGASKSLKFIQDLFSTKNRLKEFLDPIDQDWYISNADPTKEKQKMKNNRETIFNMGKLLLDILIKMPDELSSLT